MLKILTNRIMKSMWVQFIIMGPIELLKNLKKLVLPSSTTLTPETQSDLEIKQDFKVVYPPNYNSSKRNYNKWIDKIYEKH